MLVKKSRKLSGAKYNISGITMMLLLAKVSRPAKIIPAMV
jgi:hypothetical protein